MVTHDPAAAINVSKFQRVYFRLLVARAALSTDVHTSFTPSPTQPGNTAGEVTVDIF